MAGGDFLAFPVQRETGQGLSMLFLSDLLPQRTSVVGDGADRIAEQVEFCGH